MKKIILVPEIVYKKQTMDVDFGGWYDNVEQYLNFRTIDSRHLY